MNKLFKMVVEFFNSLVQAIKKIFCPKETQSRMETWAEREIDLACKRERAVGSAEWVAISKEEFEARLAMSRVLEKGSSLV